MDTKGFGWKKDGVLTGRKMDIVNAIGGWGSGGIRVWMENGWIQWESDRTMGARMEKGRMMDRWG